ncbi:MAG TPA: hypothetical protein PLZ60_10015 [Kiritimatiellia bacterium]|nr:hypothetical protein [Kiritimatiellia bacterium]
MKAAIRHTLTAARRAWLLYQMRSLESHIDGMAEAIEAVDDPMLRLRIGTARAVARRDLARLRAEYSATLPVGQRATWRTA